jgi:hypothetical protein
VRVESWTAGQRGSEQRCCRGEHLTLECLRILNEERIVVLLPRCPAAPLSR